MKAIIWSTNTCTYCEAARTYLEARNVEIEMRKLGDGWAMAQLHDEVPGARTVPQIFIDGQYIGGYDAVKEFLP